MVNERSLSISDLKPSDLLLRLLKADLSLVVLGGGPLQVQGESVALRPGLILLLPSGPELALALVKTGENSALIFDGVTVTRSHRSLHISRSYVALS